MIWGEIFVTTILVWSIVVMDVPKCSVHVEDVVTLTNESVIARVTATHPAAIECVRDLIDRAERRCADWRGHETN